MFFYINLFNLLLHCSGFHLVFLFKNTPSAIVVLISRVKIGWLIYNVMSMFLTNNKLTNISSPIQLIFYSDAL